MDQMKAPPFESRQIEGYGDEVLGSLYMFQKYEKFTDFTIKIKTDVIKCHRAVLAATCEYFSALFSSKMKETQEGEVTMDDANYNAMNTIVKHLYGVNVIVDWEDCEAFIEACEILQLRVLKEQIEKYITHYALSVDNSFAWWKIADRLNLQYLKTSAEKIMSTQLSELSLTNEFKSQSLEELLDFMKRENIEKVNRDTVLIATMEWVNFDSVSRRSLLDSILPFLCLDKCSTPVLKHMFTKHKEVFTDSSLMAAVMKDVAATVGEPRNDDSMTKLLILGGKESRFADPKSTAWFSNGMNPVTWEFLFDLPEIYQSTKTHAVVILQNGFAIMCVGENSNKNIMYNAQSKSWLDLPPTPKTLTNPCVVLCNRAIYLLGADDKTNREIINMCHMDMDELRWHTDDSLTQPGFSIPVVTSLNHKIYLVYTYSNKNIANLPFLQYDTGRNIWEPKRSLPSMDNTSLGEPNFVPIGEYLYLVGGWGKCCAQYNTQKDVWRLFSRPALGHFGRSAFVSGNKIYVCGGSRGWLNDAADAIEEYNITDDTWTMASFKLPKGLMDFTIATVPFI